MINPTKIVLRGKGILGEETLSSPKEKKSIFDNPIVIALISAYSLLTVFTIIRKGRKTEFLSKNHDYNYINCMYYFIFNYQYITGMVCPQIIKLFRDD